MHHEIDILEQQLAWELDKNGATGTAYGRALESDGRLDEAALVFGELIELGFTTGYYQLAWLETLRGDVETGESLLERYLLCDDQEDDFRSHVIGVLGHWRWHYENRADAEPLLVEGADHYPSARAALAKLLRLTDREEQAEAVLREGVAAAEVESFLPLANLLDETDRVDEAEQLYRHGYALGDTYSAYNLYLLLDREYRATEAAEWLWRAAEGGDELAIEVLTDSLLHL